MKDAAEEVIPSARRLIKSLRDIGYDFCTAVADLVDNSIEAGASRVDVLVEYDGDNSYVRISDDGKGMSEEQLKEAMRYGSERTYKEEDLGKFGLGLKTASMSQCQLFSVASRTWPELKIIYSYCWDMDHIEKTNRWEILPPRKEIKTLLYDPLEDHPGTVVLWEQLDRFLGYKHPYGDPARKKLFLTCRELEYYLAMVFHKFLAGEAAKQRLDIYINGNKVEPWDPFARLEKGTKELPPVNIKLHLEDVEGTGRILLKPYILPTKEEFSSLKAWERAGLDNWNQQQGFYIYRADRMIQSGGWCGLRTRDEHIKLSRIEVDFSPIFDTAFKINVAKMRVQLPDQIRSEVDKAIGPSVKLARDRYDGKLGSSTQPKSSPVSHASSSSAPGFSGSPEIRKFSLDEIEQKAMQIATETEKPIIIQIFQKLRKSLNGR